MAAAAAAAAVVMAWAVWIVVLPSRLAAGVPSQGLATAAALTYQAGRFVCHQAPGRSFQSGGWHWPVCGRCAGLYAGAAAGALVAVVLLIRRRGAPQTLPPRGLRLGLLAASAPTAITWVVEQAGLWPVAMTARWGSALPLGAAVSALLIWVVAGGEVADTKRAPGVH